MKKLLITITLLFSALTLVAQTESLDALKADYPQLMKKFGKELEGQRADYIFAIDVSGTMSKYKDTVVPALGEFFKSLQEGPSSSSAEKPPTRLAAPVRLEPRPSPT